MTGLSYTDSVVKGLYAGGVDYIAKPIVNSELVARMRVHIANNRLTLSAKSALDMAGHYIFAINGKGRQRWSTPQVNQLLEKADSTGQWLPHEFTLVLERWVKDKPTMGSTLPLETPTKKLKLYFLGNSSNDEYLIRLIDQEKSQEATVLKNHWKLTNRESEVLYWIAKGKANREIGQILGASPRTINKQSENIYKK
ncbi:MAG: DNA-binding CsgD family transcriptional regulator [Cellvibrionaceae bacterium]|jgi:DNA-binding CsgD family transcriptional regulator